MYLETKTDSEWLESQIESIPENINRIKPSEWAESRRYLPPTVTPIPGLYKYDVCPALREIVDCMDACSPIREVSFMKGAQIGATVGVLENTIGYAIDVLRSSPAMMVTADNDLAKLRIQNYIVPMIQQSGLTGHIQSGDTLARGKVGKTDRKIEWIGGGFLVSVGAINQNKLRSLTVQYLLLDEIDVFPQVTGKQGDSVKLAEARAKAYYNTRKILKLSTPLIKGTSRIEREFLRGDQRYYHVPCIKCGEYQILEFQGRDKNTGDSWGLVWEMDEYNIVQAGSVRYICKFCKHPHTNSDKTIMFPAGVWKPEARAISPEIRSYHLNALYAPPSMYPWEAIVNDWLNCWDVYHDRARDVELLQEFYNNNLGRSFVNYGEGVSFNRVNEHRRNAYQFGQVPNEAHCIKCAGGSVVLLTCAVDVHKSFLAVAVYGWCTGARCYVIDYWHFKGDCEQVEDGDTWGRLSDLLENKIYTSDNGREYRIALTLIDAGWSNDLVCGFCSQYAASVYPIKGSDFKATKTIREFREFTTTLGTRGYVVNVDLYKDRYAAILKRRWRGDTLQPNSHYNVPSDMTDKQLRELTVENKQPRIDARTGKRLGYEWFRPSNARNELWDLTVYNAAALDMVAYDICFNMVGIEFVNWLEFWQLCETEKLFYSTI